MGASLNRIAREKLTRFDANSSDELNLARSVPVAMGLRLVVSNLYNDPLDWSEDVILRPQYI